MNKKIICSIAAVSVIGIGMWAIILGVTLGDYTDAKDVQVGREVNAEESEDASETSESSVEAVGWGLAFQEKGVSPIGNATSEYLKGFDAYYVDQRQSEQKQVYLTFDAGYENGYTEDILDVLKAEKVPAVFFLVGDYIEANPKLVRRMVEEGHTVGNHTMTHPDMSAIETEEEFTKEIKALEKLYKDTTDHNMKKYYRPPQGKYNEQNLELAKKLGYKTIFWSIAHVDWYQDKQPTREEALNTLNDRLHPGAIVLLHSTSKTNSEILQELIQGWKKDGYMFCDIENLK